jgi:hypothetical protein
MIAHVSGVPLEELTLAVAPLAGVWIAALRARLGRGA